MIVSAVLWISMRRRSTRDVITERNNWNGTPSSARVRLGDDGGADHVDMVWFRDKMLRSYPWFGNTKVICWSMWDMVDDSDGLFWILRMCALLPVGRCNWPMQGFFLRTAHEWQREWMAPKCAGRNVAVRLHLPVPLVRWVSLFRPMRIYPRHRRNNLTVNHRIQLLSADDS